MNTDKTFRIRHLNRPESFARLISALSEQGVTVAGVATVHTGQTHAYRDLTLSLRSEKEAESIQALLAGLESVTVEGVVDEVLRLHEGGKLVHRGRIDVQSFSHMREVYTPGVAKVCRAIHQDPSLARLYTNAGNTVAVISNGTRVLGLGDIGPLASLPVMEAKALFYGQFVDLNAVPIVLNVSSVDQFVETVERLAVGFAGIHLEDIRTPDCIEIEKRLIERLCIPVMHDDQHGTAVVALAAARNLLAQCGKEPRNVTFAQVGLGAAGLAIGVLTQAAGFGRVIGFDPGEQARAAAAERGIECVSFEEAVAQGDIVSLTTGRAGLLQPSMIRRGQIILALSNPSPEIEPAVALAAGAASALDGRSVNNLLGYPGMFKGAIMAGARAITTEMKLRAAEVIASQAIPGEVLPDPLRSSVHRAVAEAVAEVASRR